MRSRAQFNRLAGRAPVSWLAFVSMGAILFLPGAPAQTNRSNEYQVKAAFLLNFAQFIDWPAQSFPDRQTAISVGVLGDDPFGAILEQTFQNESVQERAITARRSHHVEDLKSCHLMFICRSEKDRLQEILTSIGDAAIVTVCEVDDSVRRGVVINFYIDGNKVRFEINPNAAQRKGLKISSQLLKRARIVGQ